MIKAIVVSRSRVHKRNFMSVAKNEKCGDRRHGRLDIAFTRLGS